MNLHFTEWSSRIPPFRGSKNLKFEQDQTPNLAQPGNSVCGGGRGRVCELGESCHVPLYLPRILSQ